MAARYRKGATVAWSWGNGTGTGRVDTVFTQRVTRQIKGTKVTRNATEDDPAYLIVQDDGDRVLKSHGELSEES